MIPSSFFPNMPDEVRELWLEQFCEVQEWPFQSIHDSIENTKWKSAFSNIPLVTWHQARWQLVKLDYAEIRLADLSEMMIEEAAVSKSVADTFFANVADSDERINAMADFIIEHSRLPKPVIGYYRFDRFWILDGNHRFVALRRVWDKHPIEVTAWVTSLD